MAQLRSAHWVAMSVEATHDDIAHALNCISSCKVGSRASGTGSGVGGRFTDLTGITFCVLTYAAELSNAGQQRSLLVQASCRDLVDLQGCTGRPCTSASLLGGFLSIPI